MNPYIKACLILSPFLTTLLIGYLTSFFYDVPFGNEAIGALALYGLFICSPLVAIVGSIVSFATRKRLQAKRLSLYGYAIPALIICGYLILGQFAG